MQGSKIHLLQLVHQNKPAVRVQAANDGGRDPQLVTAGHIPPVFAVVSQHAILHTKPWQGQTSTVQQGHTVGPLALDLVGEPVIIFRIVGSLVLSAGFFKVGPNFPVGLLDVADGSFQLGSGFIP